MKIRTDSLIFDYLMAEKRGPNCAFSPRDTVISESRELIVSPMVYHVVARKIYFNAHPRVPFSPPWAIKNLVAATTPREKMVVDDPLPLSRFFRQDPLSCLVRFYEPRVITIVTAAGRAGYAFARVRRFWKIKFIAFAARRSAAA